MNIIGICKECGFEVELKSYEVEDGIYECPNCFHPHTLGEFCSFYDRPTKKELKISEQPIKEIIIHEVNEVPYDLFVDLNCDPDWNRPKWCNGVLFQTWKFPETVERIIQDALNGILHYSEVMFCVVERCPSILKRKDVNFEMPVLNVTGDKTFEKLSAWLKSKSKTWELAKDLDPQTNA